MRGYAAARQPMTFPPPTCTSWSGTLFFVWTCPTFTYPTIIQAGAGAMGTLSGTPGPGKWKVSTSAAHAPTHCSTDPISAYL